MSTVTIKHEIYIGHFTGAAICTQCGALCVEDYEGDED